MPACEFEPASRLAERRHVTVLFADLVGFTQLSEQRDAEDVRELLALLRPAARSSRRYGGEVEKFIGDAVMAVWGVRSAGENDAERAVRAALELVDAVAAFGEEVGAPAAGARGLVTGEAAVNLGATVEGMVAGDRGEHRVSGAVGGRARDGYVGDGDPRRDRGRDRVRGHRAARAQGQARAGAALAGARGRRGGRGALG